MGKTRLHLVVLACLAIPAAAAISFLAVRTMDTHVAASAANTTGPNPTSGGGTTVRIGNTVAMTHAYTPGINLDAAANYGPQQIYRNLLYVQGGDLPQDVWRQTFPCSPAGATASSWPSFVYTVPSTGWPVNFFAGAHYRILVAGMNAAYAAGVIGTITTSTTGVGSSNRITFGLSSPTDHVCRKDDELVVDKLSDTSLPFAQGPVGGNFGSSASSGSSLESTDLDPSADNKYQALVIPAGGSVAFLSDANVLDRTSPTAPTATPNYVLLNGKGYTLTYRAKLATTSSCTVAYAVVRNGATLLSGTDTPASSAANGTGWHTFSHTFNPAETGATGELKTTLTNSGCPVKYQQIRLVEPSAYATPFRDAVVRKLIQLHPGSIREMAGNSMCMPLDDMIAPAGNRRVCGGNAGNANYVPNSPTIGFEETLELAYAVGADAWLVFSPFYTPAEMTNLTEYLLGTSSSPYGAKAAANRAAAGLPKTGSWGSLFAAKGLHIEVEPGNEEWTNGSGTNFNPDGGAAYGRLYATQVAAMKAAPDYNASVLKFVAGGWYSRAGYDDGRYGFTGNALAASGCTLAARATCPDYVDVAPYLFVDEGSSPGDITFSGSNINSAGEPFHSIFTEPVNVESTSITADPTSGNVKVGNHTQLSQFNVNSAFYESNFAGFTQSPLVTSQNQEDQIIAGVGNGIGVLLNLALAQRDAGVTGPLNIFALDEPYNGTSCNGPSCSPTVFSPLWRVTKLMAAGTAQATTTGAYSIDTPLGLALALYNTSKGRNSNLMTTLQTGTPTLHYTAAQSVKGTPTIASNPAVPLVDVLAYSSATNGSCKGNWTVFAFNTDLTRAQPLTFTGPCAPSHVTVTRTVFGGSRMPLTAHNEASNLGNLGTPPAVVAPSPSTVPGGLASDTLPAASMTAYTYTLGP